jgi:outer membrane receptor for ferrienterochelin and colicin
VSGFSCASTASRRLQKHLVTTGAEVRDNVQQDQGVYYGEPGDDRDWVVNDKRTSSQWALFGQDEFKPTRWAIVSAGVRYDLQWLPEPIQLDANNVSPRLGAAYAPGDGRTVIRASGGLYFDQIPLRATSNALQRDGTRYQVAQLSFGQASAPRFPASST